MLKTIPSESTSAKADQNELVDPQSRRFSPPASLQLAAGQSPEGSIRPSEASSSTNSTSPTPPLPFAASNQRKAATDGPRRRSSGMQNVSSGNNGIIYSNQNQDGKRMDSTESDGGGEGEEGQIMMTERCVLVARQSDGFGLTVTGEHPVKVATIKPNGAAQMAGVRQGDRILKVNGMLVSGDNFQEVIKMISGGYNLALTLLGPPARRLTSSSSWDDELFPPLAQPKWTHQKVHQQQNPMARNQIIRQPSNGSNNGFRRSTRSESIMETDKMLDAEWRQQRAQELFRMLHRERANLDSLRNQAGLQNGQNCANLVDRALCRINELERQLHILSLLNSVSENNPNLSGKNDPQSVEITNGNCGHQPYDGKRGSIGSGETAMEKESSKTFPPTSLRTTPAVPTAQMATGGGGGAGIGAKPMEPIRSWVETGGMHYGQADVVPIGEEEEEEEEDDNDENNRLDGEEDAPGPFGNLQDLKTRPGHMAVFFTFLLNSANPSSLLFYLISDAYPSANAKEMRRFAYELFSTFLIPGAPLQLPGIAQRDIQAIDKVLRATSSTSAGTASSNPGTAAGQQGAALDHLRKLFIPTRTRAVGQINELLAQFRRKQRHFEQVVGIEAAQLDAIMARADHAGEIRLAERLLYRALAQLAHLASPNGPPDWENCERKTLALIISVATLIKIVMGIRTNNSAWEKLLDKCPTFLTPSPKSTGSVFKMRSSSKHKIHVKEHQFTLQPVFLTVHCYQCREAVWGVNPQAYFCQNCDVVIHKNCTSQLIDHCWPQQQQKSHHKGASSIPQPISQPISASAAGRLKFASGSQTSLISAPTGGIRQIQDPLHPIGRHQHPQHQHQQFLHHRDSNASSAIYAQSLFGGATESLFSAPTFHHHQHREGPHPHRKLLPSHLSSISLTPPLNRSHHSISVSAVAMAGSSKESSSIDRHGNDLIPPELIDAEGGQSKVGTATQRCQQHARLESLDSGSSPPSSSAMLPPPVFSSKFERILPPDIPPNAPPPPPPGESTATTKEAEKPTTAAAAASSSSTPKKLASEPPHPQKSMDSGIGTEGGAAKHHSSAGPTRSQSMKGEAANQQLKRGGKGAGSLGAADSAADDGAIGTGYERPIASQLAVPSASSLKSSSSSAQDLHQAFNEFPQYIRAIEAIASSSTATSGANEEEVRKMLERVERMVVADGDSDLEVETEVPNLESLISWEVLKHLKPKEKKRQEVINEFFHTERTHVRNLKILYKVFYRPMVIQRVVQPELIKLLFGNLDELLQVHSEMHQKMKMAMEMWRRGGTVEGGLYGDVGELVEGMFDGPAGERLMHATAMFCHNQQHALDTLRQRYTRSKEDQFSQFLAEAENNPLCRKLQLKDMIPVEMQRLVKYPLLLETIAKYTREGSDELQRLLHGVECAKRVLSEVNSAKRNAENVKRMDELQRRLDLTGSEKSFFQKFDFRMHKLIYEGPLQWRKDRGKTIDLHVVLLEHLLVFLTKVGPESGPANQQKLQLKIHEAGTIPIMRLASVKVDEKTGDKRAFNLLYTCDLRVFELVAQTATERKTWFRLIENQVSVTRSSPTPAELFLDGMAPPGSPSIQPIIGAGQSTPPQVQRARVDDGSGGGGGGLQMANVEQVHVLTHPSLVNANEIVIQQPTVMENAQPVLSMAERLRRSDKMIFAALSEKHRILAELICEEQNATSDELERITELMTGLSVAELKQQRAPRELAMSAIVHGNRLLESINKGMSVKLPPEGEGGDGKPAFEHMERHLPSVPCYRLTAVAAPLMNHLKALLQVIQDQEADIANLRERLKEADPNSRKTASEETLTLNDHHLAQHQRTPSRVSSGASMIVLKAIPNPEPSSPY